jgi:uncharacterized membrane protein HdeD (DUF308 family)
MENQIAKNWYMLLIKGIILVILALFVLINPEGTLKTVALLMGIGFIISGILLFLKHSSKTGESSWNMIKAEGIADLVFGLLLIVVPMVIVSVIPFLIGLWAAYYSVLVITESFKSPADGPMRLIAGIIILLLALVLVFKPHLMGLTIVIWAGILLLIYGGFNIYFSLRLNQLRLKGK